ncbi:MAG: response regulator [Thermodesulfobacteriota bacterium]
MRVLFVDDEKDFLETLIKRMKKRHVDAHAASSGTEALQSIRESSFDVIVLDVRMPDMDGIEVLRAIKTLAPMSEVIMLTGHACLEVAREGMSLGAFDYLMKPVNIDELLYKLQDACKQKRLQEEKIRKLDLVMTTCNMPSP